jgi:hypothetical protein
VLVAAFLVLGVRVPQAGLAGVIGEQRVPVRVSLGTPQDPGGAQIPRLPGQLLGGERVELEQLAGRLPGGAACGEIAVGAHHHRFDAGTQRVMATDSCESRSSGTSGGARS